MTPNVPLPDQQVKKNGDQPVPEMPLESLLVIPIPKCPSRRRSLWQNFLHDLSYLLPAFGTLLGLLLAFGQAPFAGAAIFTICPTILAWRIRLTYRNRRERRQIEALEKWCEAHYAGQQPRQTQRLDIAEVDGDSRESYIH